MKSINQYDSYEKYISHQAEKTSNPYIIAKQKRKFYKLVKYFTTRFSKIELNKNDKVLCLGARLGAEVVAFYNLGCNAIGIDIVAYPPYVVQGDFHNLKYPDGLFDVVYSNALDHSLYPNKFFSEASRVLKQNGKLVIDIRMGMVGRYEVIEFDNIQDLKMQVPESLEFESLDDTLPKLYKVPEIQVVWRKL